MSTLTSFFHEPECFDSLQDHFYWRDDFLGDSLHEIWTQTVAGTGAITLVDGDPDGQVRLQATTPDTAQLDFGDIRPFTAAKNVCIEFIINFPSNVSQIIPIFGLFYDANNYIYTRIGPADTDWHCQTCNGGAQTDYDSNQTSVANTKYFVRIECSSTAIRYYVDHILLTTITTNITANYLQPYFYLEAGAGVRNLELNYVTVRQDR